MPDILFVVDDEGSSQGQTGIVEHSVIGSDFLLDICQQRNIDGSETSFLSGLQGPLPVDEVRVDGASDDLAAVLSEVFGVVAELDNLGGADEGEVKGVEEEHQPFVLVVLEGDFLEVVLAGDPGVGSEEGSGLTDNCSGDLSCHKICFYNINSRIINLPIHHPLLSKQSSQDKSASHSILINHHTIYPL